MDKTYIVYCVFPQKKKDQVVSLNKKQTAGHCKWKVSEAFVEGLFSVVE